MSTAPPIAILLSNPVSVRMLCPRASSIEHRHAMYVQDNVEKGVGDT